MLGGMIAVLLLIAAAIYGAGYATCKWILVRRKNDLIRQGEETATNLLERAQKEIEDIRISTIAETQNKVEEKLAELEAARTTLEEEREEIGRSQRRTRNKLERRRHKLNNRTSKLHERETLLNKASQAIKSLQQEAETVHRDAEKLRAHTEGLQNDVIAHRAQLDQELALISQRNQELDVKQEELQDLIRRKITILENVAGLSSDEAKAILLGELIEEAHLQAMGKIQKVRDEATRTAKREARNILVTAVQRLAASQPIDSVISVVHINSDSVKGSIIGREGRNIRAFESATGVDVLIDDTPGAVVLSCFDPYRREIARMALTRLLQYGRIHPKNIEKFVGDATKTIQNEVLEIGKRTVIDLGLHGLHKELLRIIGRMRYRSSYGQNLLLHSIEVAKMAKLIAAELGLNKKAACRAGLLHDIGKVLPESEDISHALVGMKMCKRYGEDKAICNAVGAHHDEIEMTNLLSPIVQASDAISGSRPGARREQHEEYIKRLGDLETLAHSFDGVHKAYVIQGGREVRVMVEQDKVSDLKTRQLADDIAERIETELQYPGHIKVIVIREVRKSSTAR